MLAWGHSRIKNGNIRMPDSSSTLHSHTVFQSSIPQDLLYKSPRDLVHIQIPTQMWSKTQDFAFVAVPREFPSSPIVGLCALTAEGLGWILGWGTKVRKLPPLQLHQAFVTRARCRNYFIQLDVCASRYDSASMQSLHLSGTWSWPSLPLHWL